MKYRIKQIGSDFYPQQKWLGLFWRSYAESNGNTLKRDSLISAKDFIRYNHNAEPEIVIHKFEEDL